MYLLLWNDELYMYDLRIIRYFVLMEAIMFIISYFFSFAVLFDLVIVEGQIYYEDNLPEMLLALIIGELGIYYMPTALINMLIIMKEMTLS